MSKIDEMAMKKADKWRDEYLDAWTESEAEIARDAFADGYCMAIEDLYPVVKPEDCVLGNRYWALVRPMEGWLIVTATSHGGYRSGPHTWRDDDCKEIRGPIRSPIEVGIVGSEG